MLKRTFPGLNSDIYEGAVGLGIDKTRMIALLRTAWNIYETDDKKVHILFRFKFHKEMFEENHLLLAQALFSHILGYPVEIELSVIQEKMDESKLSEIKKLKLQLDNVNVLANKYIAQIVELQDALARKDE